MERRKYLFKGRVQGVGFRFRCFSIANELKLTGFVKNEYDGSVSMEVQGEGMQIERMIEKLYQQPFIEIEQIHYHLFMLLIFLLHGLMVNYLYIIISHLYCKSTIKKAALSKQGRFYKVYLEAPVVE